jgi:ankyrin repeat protein
MSRQNLDVKIHLAVTSNVLSSASLLLDMGADVNGSTGGFSPLQRAVLFSRDDFVKMFIKRGADIDFQDDLGQNALMLASMTGSEVVRANLRKQPVALAVGNRSVR